MMSSGAVPTARQHYNIPTVVVRRVALPDVQSGEEIPQATAIIASERVVSMPPHGIGHHRDQVRASDDDLETVASHAHLASHF